MKPILSPELRAQTTSDKNIYLQFNNAEPLSIPFNGKYIS